MEAQQASNTEKAERAMMLLPITQDGTLLGNRHPDRVLLCAAAPSVMNRLCLRKEYYPPTGIPTTLAPVHIFGIHEESFVEEAELIDGLASGQPKAAYQNVHIQNTVALKKEHMFTTEEK